MLFRSVAGRPAFAFVPRVRLLEFFFPGKAICCVVAPYTKNQASNRRQAPQVASRIQIRPAEQVATPPFAGFSQNQLSKSDVRPDVYTVKRS